MIGAQYLGNRTTQFRISRQPATLGIELRSFVFLDNLQPQHAAYMGTVASTTCNLNMQHIWEQ